MFNRMYHRAAASCLAALLMSSVTAQAATVFTDRAAWEAAVTGTITTDTFDTPIATADAITFASGVVATKSSSGIPPTVNQVGNGTYSGFVQRDGFRTIEFAFPGAVTAFGGTFSDLLNSLFVTGLFDGVEETLSITSAIGTAPGFFGVVGAASFSSLVFTTNAGVVLFPGGGPLGGELFSIDDLSFAQPAAIPLPAALPLLLTALGGLVIARRRRAL